MHLVVWRRDHDLLDQIRLPAGTVVWHKDDVPELVDDDFRNQMYLKLIADRYAEADWFWLADADYLVCAPLTSADFLSSDGRPCWFYRPWGPEVALAERTWRAGSEALLGAPIPYLFLSEPQYVMSRSILRDLRGRHDVTRLLRDEPMPADQVVYGAYAFAEHHARYYWIDA
ncbi:MAG: hypothetical protein WDA75_25395, partial [Candidatus Latescibacterota bacterium]